MRLVCWLLVALNCHVLVGQLGKDYWCDLIHWLTLGFSAWMLSDSERKVWNRGAKRP